MAASAGSSAHAFGVVTLPTNAWSYLAATYDGATLRLYVNGTFAASQAKTGAITSSTNALTIGSDPFYGQYFSGLIDNVRIYNSALTQTQIQTDMTTPVAPQGPDTDAALCAGHAERDRDQRHPRRSQLGRSHRQHRRHRLPDRALPRRRLQQLRRDRDHHYQLQLQRHHHRSGHQLQLPRPRERRRPQPRPLHQHRHRLDPQPRPDPALGAGHAERDRDQQHPRRSQLGRGNRQHRRHRLPDRTLPGHRLHHLRPDRDHHHATSYSDTTTAAGTSYSYRVRANDAVPNFGPYTNTATAATTPVQTGPTPIAAYAFDEGSGTTVTDQSGNGNNGTLANTTWASAGKYGGALSFNGTSSRVTVPNSASLQLSTGMTLEAWVNPTTVSSGWRDVIEKGNDDYYLMGTTDHSGSPGGGGTLAAPTRTRSAPQHSPTNTWTHLAATYDRPPPPLPQRTPKSRPSPRPARSPTSTNPLTIGSDPFYGQYFSGLIDNVRIYNSALTQTQIQTDMTTPVSPQGPDLRRPVRRAR